MKGTKTEPQCGFSAQAVHALATVGANFVTVDVLENPDVRQQLPRVSNWPTFPQLFINGELIGGSDIIRNHLDSGQLESMVKV